MSAALPRVGSLSEMDNLAERLGAQPHLVDGATLRSKDDALKAIANALSFPDSSGHNLDALFDRLRDLSWLPGEHLLALTEPVALIELDVKAWRGIERAITDAVAAQTSRLHAVLVRTDS